MKSEPNEPSLFTLCVEEPLEIGLVFNRVSTSYWNQKRHQLTSRLFLNESPLRHRHCHRTVAARRCRHWWLKTAQTTCLKIGLVYTTATTAKLVCLHFVYSFAFVISSGPYFYILPLRIFRMHFGVSLLPFFFFFKQTFSSITITRQLTQFTFFNDSFSSVFFYFIYLFFFWFSLFVSELWLLSLHSVAILCGSLRQVIKQSAIV